MPKGLSEAPQVSVIIPVYQVNPFLFNCCVDSLLQQTQKSVELLFVIDGEPDSATRQVLDSFSSNKQVHILPAPHGGVSSARNVGLSQSKGEWIMFVDADDTVPPDAIELLIETAEKNKNDLVFGDYYTFWGKSREKHFYREHSEVFVNGDICRILKEMVDPTNAISSVWAKLFSRRLLINNNICFDRQLSVGEDTQFVVRAVAHCTSLAYLHKVVYEYRRNSESAVWTFHSDYVGSVVATLQSMRNTISTWSNSYEFGSCYDNYVLFHLLLIQVHYLFNSDAPWSERERKQLYKRTIDLPIFTDSLKRTDFKMFSLPKRVSLFSLRCRWYWLSCIIAKIRQGQLR
jgi:glycosyltransferase involved in cell wall biosynthesis